MKKEIRYEVDVCDLCGEESSSKCEICEKDVCSECGIALRKKNKSWKFWNMQVRGCLVCPGHLPKELR